MDYNEFEKATEIAKNASEAVKNFYSIIERLFDPHGIKPALQNGHERIIESYIHREDIDEFSKIAFLSGYKKMIKEYKNSIAIANLAAPQIAHHASPEKVEDDWFSFFFDKVRLVSDKSVQNMWAKILANEVNTPGTFSRSLLHTLSIMSTSQARIFCNIARFCMKEYGNNSTIHPLLFIQKNYQAYEQAGITSDALMDLAYLGLVQCDFNKEFVFNKKKVFLYGNKAIAVYGNPNYSDKIQAGNVLFTRNGQTLFSIVDEIYKQYDKTILDFTVQKLKRRGCSIYINNQRA